MSYPVVREMLVETFSFDPTRLEEGGTQVEKLSGGRYRFRAKAQHCGLKNRNNRVYPVPVWEQHTTPTCAFIKRVNARRVIGHLEHPSDGKSQMGMAAVLVVEVVSPNEKGEVWSVFETLSTPAGLIVASFIRDGVGFGISSRGNGSVVNKGGIDEVQEDYEPITFDMVIDESTPGAEVHARRLKESLCALMESVGGDPIRAIRMDQELAEEAVVRDLLIEQLPPAGFSRFCMAFDDGSAHYRAYDNGIGQWDVWLHPHNLPPKEIVKGLSTYDAANEASKQHYRLVQMSGMRAAEGEAAMALQRKWSGEASTMREAFSVRNSMPYSGLCLKLAFTSVAEAKTALSHIQKSGFHADLDGELVSVYTTIEDPDAAKAHLARLLASRDIEMQTEAVGVIQRGEPFWEDTMTLRRLNEMPYGGMEEMPYDTDAEDGAMYDAYDNDDDDDDDDDDAYEGEDDDDEDDDDDDEDDEDDDDGEDEGMYEMGDDGDQGYDGDDPEDIDLDVDVDEGYVKIWYDGDDNPVEYHHYTANGILEGVTDADGDLLVEMPTGAMRAMFAKAHARDDVKATEKSGTATKARLANPEYYRKFRSKGAKGGTSKRGIHGGKGGKFAGSGADAKTAASGHGRFKKGKKVRGGDLPTRIAKGAAMMKRPPVHKVFQSAPTPKYKGAKKKKKGRAKKESFFDREANLVETYIGNTLVEVSDPATGLVLFELRGGSGSPAAAAFGKMFSQKKWAEKIRAKSPKNYNKLRAGYADTKHGKGMSPTTLKTGSRALPAKEKKARRAERKVMAPFKKAARKLRKGAAKMASQGSLKKGAKFNPKGSLKVGNLRKGGGKKKLKASWDGDFNDLLIEDETGALISQYYDTEVGGIDEDGDVFFYDADGDVLWLDEDGDLVEYLDDEGDDYATGYDEYMEEMEVGAHGGGKPVALRMKGQGTRGYGTGPVGAHGGGKHGVKTKTGSPYGMRGGGNTEDADEAYDPYVLRLEDQLARQQEIIDAYTDLQHTEAMEEARTSILGAHPELSVVESRLDRCSTPEEMRVEAEALLTLVETSRSSQAWNGPVNGVNSGMVDGVPAAGLLAEGDQFNTGFDAAMSGVGSSDTASRVAAARRRRLDETTNH